MDNKEVIFKIVPKYNLVYELGMPTGKKVASTLKIFTVILIVFIIFCATINQIDITAFKQVQGVDLVGIIRGIAIVILLILALKVVIQIFLQVMQYHNTSFTFYDKYLTYEDNFLNQHKKTIQYLNIREIEIRKNIWDRMNGFGIIVIYTNAENEYNNGLVMFGVKNPDEYYAKIDEVVHSHGVDNESNSYIPEDDSKKPIKKAKTESEVEKEFRDSLK